MPLQKFAPVSPDPSIQTDGDMTLAKFGHLNSVIDYINTYVAADSLQLEGTGSLSATPRYITDAGGNLSSLAISTGNIGIGTSTPDANLNVRTTDGFGSVKVYNNNDSSTPLHLLRANGGGVGINTFSSGGTINSPTDRGLGYLTRFTGQVYVDGAFRTAARIEYYLTSAPSAANLNCGIRFMTASPTTYSIEERVGITSDGNLQIGDSIVNNRNSKVFIKGLGSTSATTSLLVQNSSGTNLFKIEDSGSIYGNGTQASNNFVLQKDSTNDLIIYSSATWGGLLTPPTSGGANTMINGRITGTHGGYGNVAMGLGTIQADGSAFNFNTAIGQGSFIRGTNSTAIGNEATIATTTTLGYYCTAIGYQATTSTTNAVAIGNQNALLQIGGNFVPTARVHVKGLGSTSATTSLLVQNSSGTETFRVYDSGSVNVGLGLTIGSGQSVSDGTFALNNQNLQSYNSFSIETVPQNRQIKLRPASVEVLAANYYLAANQIGVVVYDTGSYSHSPSAVLQANSTTRGFLPPRMTTAEKTAIASPAAGLMVYDTDLNKSFTYDGTTWQAHW